MLSKYIRSTGMRHNSRLIDPTCVSSSLDTGRGEGARAISARHQLLSDSWTAEVQALEAAIGRFRTDKNPPNTCQVVFFEIAGDEHLHVNVTHKYATKSVRGWAGPGS